MPSFIRQFQNFKIALSRSRKSKNPPPPPPPRFLGFKVVFLIFVLAFLGIKTSFAEVHSVENVLEKAKGDRLSLSDVNSILGTIRGFFFDDSTGFVGVGTDSPAARLHIDGADNDGISAALKISAGGQMMLIDGNEIDSYDNGSPAKIYINHNAKADTIFNGNGGKVGIGTSSPCTGLSGNNQSDCKLQVMGHIFSNGTSIGSDARLKKNIEKIPSALEKVLALRGVNFDWKKEEFPERNFADGRQVGLIAQEVEVVFPELVSSGDYKSVSYSNLVAPMIEAIKELNQKVVELESEIEQMRN